MQIKYVIVIILIVPLAYAHNVSVDELINNMLAQQDVSSVQELDCSKISDAQMEMLGDAVMERMAGSEELHEQMDNMMGGSGSQSLKQTHIAMGLNWLECNNQEIMGNYEMINSGMMGPMMMRMMGNYYPAYYNSFDSVLIFTILGWVLFVITLFYFHFAKQTKQKIRRR